MWRAIAAIALFVVGCSSGDNTIPATPTPPARVYVLTTNLALDAVRQVASAYEQGEAETAQEICLQRRNDLYLEGLTKQFAENEGPMLDHDTFVEICETAAAEGWPAVRDAALAAID